MEKTKLIIDCDAGIDDMQAIMLALSRQEAEVLAITCVNGNTNVDNVCRNVLRVLSVCNRMDIPVYKGCTKALVDHGKNAEFFHGRDGLSDLDDHPEVDLDSIQTEHASCAINRIVNESQGDITLIGIGPLTNIAVAIRLNPDLGKRLKKCVIMGGNTEGQGNIEDGSAAEFNFHCDPEAAYMVLHELSCPIIAFSWEAVLKHHYSWDWLRKILEIKTTKAIFHSYVLRTLLDKHNEWRLPGFMLCDPTAVAIALHETIVTKSRDVFATVELHGRLSRGQMISNNRHKPNVTLAQEIDTDIMMKLISNVFKEES
nr:inosine-uridine preferring nucleoside hydrolase-like isoform X3 [Crassostrea virginica]XP_022335562.1 inosine-uridine preferring nucleoside hydrolase-like isoform X3 [Crassostrea virginica]XP_022335563.1 inosine-uridine preferring nucleoside hydrolase-like isoform X3 [Crassostrea virginica]